MTTRAAAAAFCRVFSAQKTCFDLVCIQSPLKESVITLLKVQINITRAFNDPFLFRSYKEYVLVFSWNKLWCTSLFRAHVAAIFRHH